MPIVIADLSVWLVCFGALLLILLATQIVKGILGLTGGVLAKLPVVGGWANRGIHDVERKLVGYLADAAEGVDAAMGWSLHQIAREIDWLGRELNRHAGLLALIASLIPGSGQAKALWNALSGLHLSYHGLKASLLQDIRRLHAIEQRLAHGIGADVLPRIRSLEREYTRVIEHDVATLRARTRTLEREYSNLYRWMRSHPWTVATEAFAAAMATVLARWGLGWLRCPSLGRLGKTFGCLPFAALEDLFLAEVTALAVTDICDFAAAAYALAETLQPVFIDLVDVENALIGCHGASAPPVLGIGRLSLPPVADPLPLAA